MHLLLLLLSLTTTTQAWHCAKTKHTRYLPACCDEVEEPVEKDGKFGGVDYTNHEELTGYQPFPVVVGNTTVKNEYTCVSDGTVFGSPGCCKVDDKRKNLYTCKPVVE
ncbi:uncharacterized protein RSE6_04110 [Rhynchosporium secalis]|uniref:Uncharacterized protein n=1 Tax=Rhynchosporium secalis TaxID=38038 RepID=A0A1E1M4G2_RHYSE|nr:uncharacterized protein RSE6_04110 [Rhynchosporium secalis]